MWRRFARLSEKTSEAQFPEDGGDLGNRPEGLLAAARLRSNPLIGIAPKTYRYVISRSDDVSSASGCDALLPHAGGSAIGACTSCYGARASS